VRTHSTGRREWCCFVAANDALVLVSGLTMYLCGRQVGIVEHQTTDATQIELFVTHDLDVDDKSKSWKL
jgi:hypothetical protein